MRDTRAIASSGYLSSYKRTRNIAVDGYLAPVVVVIPLPESITTVMELRGKERKKRELRDEEEILAIIRLFMKLWH